MDWLYAVVAFVVVTALFTFLGMRQRNSSWQGAVTGIKEYSRTDSEDRHHEGVYVYYRKDSGKKGKLDINRLAFSQLYSDLAVGDRLEKVKGEYLPKKLRSSGLG